MSRCTVENLLLRFLVPSDEDCLALWRMIALYPSFAVRTAGNGLSFKVDWMDVKDFDSKPGQQSVFPPVLKLTIPSSQEDDENWRELCLALEDTKEVGNAVNQLLVR